VQLGQFTDAHADEIVAALEKAGIHAYAKRFGRIVRTMFAADWGTRLFVDGADYDRATAVAREIAPDGLRRRRPR
jgi:hypothetical protein